MLLRSKSYRAINPETLAVSHAFWSMFKPFALPLVLLFVIRQKLFLAWRHDSSTANDPINRYISSFVSWAVVIRPFLGEPT